MPPTKTSSQSSTSPVTIQAGRLQQVIKRDGRIADFDPKKMVIFEQAINFSSSTNNEILETSKIIESHSTLVKTETKLNEKGILVLADSYYPGWTARVDNEAAKIYPVNGNQRGVILDPGEHEVIFEFKPNSFTLGLLISSMTLILLIGILVLSNTAKRPNTLKS